MAYKTILVHLDSGKRCPARLDLGIRLAQRFDAHLVGLHALTVVRLPGYAVAEVGPQIVEEQRRRAAEYAAEAQTAFRRTVDRAGLERRGVALVVRRRARCGDPARALCGPRPDRTAGRR